ncbi:hypothetical protein ACQKFM_14125 [Paenibacillus xylanexedens]|uniref:hypothetical protein n=1 Tax=Paenibacillus xylanexedens TaxID=528191 RepID=UPI003D029034
MVKLDKTKFIQTIKNYYEENGIDKTIQLVKKSGICINPYGTGRPREKNLYKDIIEFLKEQDQNSKVLTDFEQEVRHLNDLYKKFNIKYVSEIEGYLTSELHVCSYLIALEIFLTEFNAKTSHDLAIGKINGLNNNFSDIYENIVESTGLVLKYFLYKKYEFNGLSKRIPREFILCAGKHFNSSGIRNYLDTIVELWNYFDNEIEVVGSNQLNIKAMGEHAKGRHISHMMFMDIRNAKMSRQSLEQYIFEQKYTPSKTLPPEGYISKYEKSACEFIQEYFSFEDLNVEFNGIKLSELVRAYSLVAIECDKFIKHRKRISNDFIDISLNDICMGKSKQKWISKFINVGIRKDRVEKILDFMTFDINSNDLFDSPFIKIGNNYVVIPSASYITDSARAILLNLNSKGIDISKKGTEFEKGIREAVSYANVKCIHLEKKDYECDAVFSLGNDLFFIETKHLNHPTSYREYMRNLDDLNDACSQLDRIVGFYLEKENLIKIKNELGLEYINNVYKMVVTNTSQGQTLKVNDTLITDDTHFVGYFKRRPPQIVEISSGVVTTRSLFSEYYEGQVNTEQFINLIELSPLIEQNKKRVDRRIIDLSDQIGIKFEDYYIKINTIVTPEFLSHDEQKEFSSLYG